jgi:type III restriction enzyme
MQLKDYQVKLLDAYAGYLRLCRETGSAKEAYIQSVREWGELAFDPTYFPLPGAADVPYVCLRVPTGGGKTFLGAHSIQMVKEHYLPSDQTLTLWLVPSEAIRSQTLRILKDREHPLTQSLRRAVGSLEILDVSEALYVTPSTLDTHQTIIVATMQSFKRDDTSGLRMQKENGHLMDHFSRKGIKEEAAGNHSLMDVLRLRRPFVIIDEAHNQGTPLALDTVADFKPCAVLELTATPDRNYSPSNVLRSISAAALQAEDMLKLPLELGVHPDWKTVLSHAIERRASLEKDAIAEYKDTGESIRPVLFIQAEKSSKTQETMVPEKVKEALIKDYHIPESNIAICIGGLDEIGERKMEDANFPRVIITIDKLREGWDCPFAYVLMTFRNTTSRVAVEQVVGRILRMPHVKRKKRESLNRAYCYACSSDFSEVVRSLKDGLVESGFDRMEARDLIVTMDSEMGRGDLFTEKQEVVMNLPVVDGAITTPDLSQWSKAQQSQVELSPETGTLTIVGQPSPALQKSLVAAISKVAGEENGKIFKLGLDQELTRTVTGRTSSDYPSRTGAKFSVPMLMLRQGSFFHEFEESALLDGDWTLSDDCDAQLSDTEFPTKIEDLKKFRFDMQAEKVSYSFYEEQELELRLLGKEQGWSITSLTQWLDWNTDFHYADQQDKVAWIRRMLEELLQREDVSIEDLAYRKFRLRDAVRSKLQDNLVQIKQQSFKDLFAAEDAFEVPGGEHCINFLKAATATTRPIRVVIFSKNTFSHRLGI